MNQDPWRHRSENMCCKTCMWLLPKVPSRGYSATSQETAGVVNVGGAGGAAYASNATDSTVVVHQLGRCRRHAPTLSGFPVVFMNDWCGDHRLDENKLL